MYTVTLIPGDNAWTNDAVHECDDKGIVKICQCFKNIQIQNKNEYIRLKNILQEERKEKGLIAQHETSNLWLLNRPTEFGYIAGSFIVPSPFHNIYQLKSDLERTCDHLGLLANDVSFQPIEYVPSQKPRSNVTIVREPLIHSYSNEVITEYACWDDLTQDFIIKQDIKYELCTSNAVKKVQTSNITYTSNLVYTSNVEPLILGSNETSITIGSNETSEWVISSQLTVTSREIPIMIEKEKIEYEYDPLDSSKILYDIDYTNLQPKYPIKYLSSEGVEITKENYLNNINENHLAMYVPYVKLTCDHR